MDTPRRAYMVNATHPGSDVAAETAAALAAASVAFTEPRGEPVLSTPHFTRNRQTISQSHGTIHMVEKEWQNIARKLKLFQFAKNHRGLYQNSIPSSRNSYSSSGDEDELLWAAVWLYIATGDQEYKAYISGTKERRECGGWLWGDKFVGAQALVAKVMSKS
ncbi:hypothetical protein ZWY2020_016776 [Hordeum vulgare]|nr:hypothetical protein ZWY2020_016776 [Hordeum vulgare]